MKFISLPLITFLAASFIGLNSCRNTIKLTPGSEAIKLPEIGSAATASLAGVSLIVQAQAWEGNPMIEEHVTPLRVTIKNNSGKAIKLCYSDIALISNSGKIFAALPPYAVQDTIQETGPLAYPEIVDPTFFYDGFSIAPYYSPRYNGLETFDGLFPYNQPYYDQHYEYWAETPLPTTDMLQKALPDGVIYNDGKVIGFLYFEAVPAQIQKLIFRMNVINAENGEILGMISIPFIAH